MPYFPGFGMVDASGNRLQDSGGVNYMKEPDLSVNQLLGQLGNVANLVGPVAIANAVEDGLVQAGVPADIADVAGDVAGVSAALAPVAVAVLSPTVGLGVTALAILDAGVGLAALYNAEQGHYNAITNSGEYSLSQLDGITQVWLNYMFELTGTRIQEGTTTIVDDIGTTQPDETVISRINGLQGEIQSVGQAVADLPAEIAVLEAPVWPGLAGVTLGTPVALSDSVAIDEPMHGVIIAVTTPPGKVGVRVIGGEYFDYNCGELTFATDEGDLEPWQYLGFRAAIFTPKTMAQAGGVRLRVLGGAEGTVTPWTLTP